MSSEIIEKNKRPYSEQCLIRDFFDFFSGIHGTPGKNQGWKPPEDARAYGIVNEPYNIMKVDSDHLNSNLGARSNSRANEGSVGFMTRLGSPKAQRLLENVPKEVMANLQPKIELYKMFYKDANDVKGVPVKMPFNNFQRPGPSLNPQPQQHISDSEGQPGHLAVSLKEFSFDYLGTNPAEVDYYINVQLKLWFSTTDALMHQHPIPENIQKLFGGAKQTISFRELIERPTAYAPSPTDSISHNAVYAGTNHMAWDSNYFRIRADISYATPNEEWLEEASKHIYKDPRKGKEELMEAITTIKTSFFLNLLRHTFNYRPDLPTGPFELDISYVGAVETALYSQDASILRSSVDERALETLKISGDINGKPYFSYYEAMMKISDQIFQDFGVRIGESANMSDYFEVGGSDNLKIGGRPLAFWSDDAWRNKVLHFRRRATSGAPSAQGALLPKDNRVRMQGGDNEYDRFLKHKSGLRASRGRGTIESQSFANAMIAFFSAKASWHNELQKHGLRDDQVKTSMYARIFHELSGHEKHCGDVKVKRRNRFYQITVPAQTINKWLLGRSTEEKTAEEEQKKINDLQGGLGPGANDNRKKIEKIRKARENRVQGKDDASMMLIRQDIYKTLWDQLKAKGTDVPENRTAQMPGVPLVMSDEDEKSAAKVRADEKLKADFEFVDRISKFVSSKLGFTRNKFGVSDLNPSQRAPTKGEHTISWIYFGDLIDAALEILRDNDRDSEKLKLDIWRAPIYDQSESGTKKYLDQGGGRLKVILGDITYHDQISGQKKTINLSSLPISYELFREFWTKKVIEPMLSRYSFLAFLKDAMTDLVQAALTNRCALTGQPIVGIRPHIIQQTVGKDSQLKVYAYPPKGVVGVDSRGLDRMWRALIINKDPATFRQQWGGDETIVDPSTLPPDLQRPITDMSSADRNEEQEIIYLCATTDTANDFLKVDKERDVQNGILYLEVGVDGTPLESISFSRRDQPFFLEGKAEQSRIKGEPLQLSEPYNCSFSLFGNNFTKPGTFVYIRMPHLGLPNQPSSPAMRLGLGGYFMITKCSNSIILRGNKLDWRTDAQCVWNSFGEIKRPSPRTFR